MSTHAYTMGQGVKFLGGFDSAPPELGLPEVAFVGRYVCMCVCVYVHLCVLCVCMYVCVTAFIFMYVFMHLISQSAVELTVSKPLLTERKLEAPLVNRY